MTVEEGHGRRQRYLRRCPAEWSRMKIFELGEVHAGKALSSKGKGQPRPYLRVANVFDGRISVSDVSSMPFTDDEWAQYMLKPGDVLLNEGQSLHLVGRAAMYRGEPQLCAFQNSLIRFKAGHRIDESFALALFRYLQQSGVFSEIALQTTTVAHLGVSRFAGLEIALPTIDEQRKIAAILSVVDDAIEATQTVINQLQVVKQAMTTELLTRGLPGWHTRFKQTAIGQLPEKWSILRLEDLASVDRGKFSHRPRNDPRFFGGQYPFIQTGDVAASGGRIRSYNQTLNDDGMSVSRLFPAGTIVITIAANIGDTAIAMFPVAFPDSLVGIQASDRIENRFLELVLRTRKTVLEQAAPQNAQKNINLETLRPLEIQVPPPEEQRRIADIFDAVQERLDCEKSILAAQKGVKEALMTALLTGAVRVNSDEGPP